MAPRYHFDAKDYARRRGERRFMALQALGKGPRNPQQLAEAWKVSVSSAYKVLERLRKSRSVERVGTGYAAIYRLTDVGRRRMAWWMSAE